jgi:hypothetical protein
MKGNTGRKKEKYRQKDGRVLTVKQFVWLITRAAMNYIRIATVS